MSYEIFTKFYDAVEQYWANYTKVNHIAFTGQHDLLNDQIIEDFNEAHFNILVQYVGARTDIVRNKKRDKNILKVIENVMVDIKVSYRWMSNWIKEPSAYYDSATYPTRSK